MTKITPIVLCCGSGTRLQPANAIQHISAKVVLVCPSDHHVGNPAAFAAATSAAADLAQEGWLVAFGIEAKTPETGFGYLRQG